MINQLKIFRIIFLIIFSLIFFFILLQNFLISSSFELLSFRSIDDYAFQSVLRRYHERMIDLRFDSLFKLYDYGYGWIFWIINIVVTFPFYIISLFHDESLLIVAPRIISQAFSFATAFIIYKILKIYSEDKYIPYFGAIFYLSFPYFAFSAMSFRTIAQINFFSALSFYYAIKPGGFTLSYLKNISIAFAAAIGTKLSAALLSPLLLLIIFDRAGYKFTKEKLIMYMHGLKIFIFYLIIFINPSFFLAIFEPSLFTDHASVLSYYMTHITTNYGTDIDLITKITQAYSSSYMSSSIIIIMLLLFLWLILNKDKYQIHYIYILAFIIFSGIYLANHVNLGVSYITNYFSAYSFLILLSIVFFKNFSTKMKITLLTSLFLVNASLNFNYIKTGYLEHYKTATSNKFLQMKLSQSDLKKIIPMSSSLNILYDHRGPMIYSDLRDGVYARALFDNISEIIKTENKVFEVIILNKKSIAFLSKEEFNSRINFSDKHIKDRWIDSRMIVNKLLNQNEFLRRPYEKIYEKGNIIAYRIVK